MPHHVSDILEASGLTCVRGDESIFSGLSLSARAGEVVQLHGSNGSGKTSLLRILCGIAPAESGEVRWNGQDIREAGNEYRRHLGFIGHRRGVCEDLSPLENLLFATALERPRTVHECREALDRLSLTPLSDTPARLLSAGQNQRTALARLLLTNTKVWLLDEPFTALDRAGQAAVEKIITNHATNGGICVIATHQPMDLKDTTVNVLSLAAA